MKKLVSLLLVMVLCTAVFAGCNSSSGGDAPAQDTPAQDVPEEGVDEPDADGAEETPAAEGTEASMELTSDIKNMSIGGAGTSGTFYIMAAAYADLITKNLGINTIAEVTAGSVENVTLLADDKIEMGVVQLDVTMDALAGEGFDAPVPLTVVAPMYPNTVQIVALADSDIETVEDLRGKRVSVGSPGSGILATNEIILDTLGLSMDDIKPQYLSFTETTDAFRNNAVDAVIVNTAAPAPFLVDLETSNAIKMIQLTDEQISLFTEGFPFYVESVIPGGTYSSVPEDTKTFAVWIALMANEDFPEDVAYHVTKALFENADFLADVHVVAEYMHPDSVAYIQGVPFHPGTVKYLEEIGVSIP